MKPARLRMMYSVLIAALLAITLRATAQEQNTTATDTKASAPPAPPTNLVVKDHPWDGGDEIDLTWDTSADDPGNAKGTFAGYKVYRSRTASELEDFNGTALAQAATAAKKTATDAMLESNGLSTDPDSRDFEKLSDADKAKLKVAREAAAKAAKEQKQNEIDSKAGETSWMFLSTTKPGETEFTADKLHSNESYTFKVEAYTLSGVSSAPAVTAASISPVLQWWDGGRLWLAIIALVLCGAIVYWIIHARRGKPIKVRKIAGLEAVDEAVGRATEMGRSCVFVPGIQDMNDIQTIAGITVLSRVARTAAEYDAKVEVPTSRSLVMTTAREAVQASYLAAGRPDAYNEDLIYYVTDEQFGYVAYLSGMMVREKPAACFYMGSFFAESLILAETGNSIGAIQVAGTAQPAQLPFFVAACDYTLIGEEFFAASAYLSGSPEELGSLKGQDVGKLIVWVFMAIGITLFTVAVMTHSDKMMEIVNYIKGTMLT